MGRFTKRAWLGTAAIVLIGAALAYATRFTAWSPSTGAPQATIGSINLLQGGAYSKDLTEGSVQPYGDHSITGVCQNGIGYPMTDVTIELIATSGTPPGLGGPSKVNNATPSASTPKGKKWTFDPPIDPGGALSLDLTTTAPESQPAASTFKIYITPSHEPRPGVEADHLGLFVFTPQRALHATDLEAHGNKAMSLLVAYSDPNSNPQRITKLIGTVTFSAGEQNEITSVDVLQGFGGDPVSGAAVQVSSATEFVIDHISIPTGATRAIVIHTLVRPAGTTTLSLRAVIQGQ